VEHGVVPEALLRAEQEAQGVRDGEGQETARSGELVLEVGLEPLRGFLMLTLGTVAVATGMIDAVGPPQCWH
jgi:hypothetical protein